MREEIVGAFVGTYPTQPTAVRVRIGNDVRKVYFTFGEIILPFKVDLSDVEAIEKEHACRIEDRGSYVAIVPLVVDRLINEFGYVSSMSEYHREELRKWLERDGVEVLKKLLRK